MKCVIIFGPSAVGKATVGKELANNLGYKLFHNHMVIELVHNFFTWSDAEFWKLVGASGIEFLKKSKHLESREWYSPMSGRLTNSQITTS